MTRRAIRELDGIATDTASMGGCLRQFEMADSRDCRLNADWQKTQSLQEHVEKLYGMLQRICRILIEEGK